MGNTRSTRGGAVAIALLVLATSQTMANSADKLTADQVRSTFVGREWSQGNGTFMFATDGTYRYSDPGFSVQGTYRIAPDGELCTVNTGSGTRTCYTFYRDGSGYRYWHDRSRRFWPAYLR